MVSKFAATIAIAFLTCQVLAFPSVLKRQNEHLFNVPPECEEERDAAYTALVNAANATGGVGDPWCVPDVASTYQLCVDCSYNAGWINSSSNIQGVNDLLQEKEAKCAEEGTPVNYNTIGAKRPGAARALEVYVANVIGATVFVGVLML